MNYENMWETLGIKINSSGNLVIQAIPSYGNRKRWEGEMEFTLSTEQLRELTDEVEERKTKERMREVAVAELTEYLEGVKASYQEKKTTLAGQLGLTVEEMPRVKWWSLDENNGPVMVA